MGKDVSPTKSVVLFGVRLAGLEPATSRYVEPGFCPTELQPHPLTSAVE